MEKELRKRQILLAEAGFGVILFAVWNVAKVNLYLGLSELPVQLLHEEAVRDGIDEKFLLYFIITIAAAILIWQLSIRLYIGLSATAEGRGKKKGNAYLVWTAILLVTDLQMIWQTFGVDQLLAGEKITVDQITSFCLEAASMYVLLQLLLSGIRVKILRKKMKV